MREKCFRKGRILQVQEAKEQWKTELSVASLKGGWRSLVRRATRVFHVREVFLYNVHHMRDNTDQKD